MRELFIDREYRISEFNGLITGIFLTFTHVVLVLPLVWGPEIGLDWLQSLLLTFPLHMAAQKMFSPDSIEGKAPGYCNEGGIL